jgi:hypothetical protein
MSSFSKKHKQLGDVLSEKDISHIRGESFQVIESLTASDYFNAELKLTLEEVPYNVSEFAICETLVYPVLREVWKGYKQYFNIWSRALVKLNIKIKGYPDYLIAKRAKQSPVIFGQPYIAVVEAKLDDFEGAWGQCLYEMWAIQQLNLDKTKAVYGITSSGLIWQFGKLQNNEFTQYSTLFSIKDIDMLLSALKTFFEISKTTLEAHEKANNN